MPMPATMSIVVFMYRQIIYMVIIYSFVSGIAIKGDIKAEILQEQLHEFAPLQLAIASTDNW